jgi:putative Mg2+ transporter-C (MgtC) family protein
LDSTEIAGATLKLLLACLFGGLVGWQRESHERPAGFRTHILVCVGSCLIMLVSVGAAAPTWGTGRPADPGRIAAQVVSGIGFLGAGTILRQGNAIRGLTTAASLWTVAGIGLAAGLGGAYALLGGVATLLVLATLTVFSRLERQMSAARRAYDVEILAAPQAVGDAKERLLERGVRLTSIEREGTDTEEGLVRLRLNLFLPTGEQPELLTHGVAGVPGVRAVRWE